MITRRSFRDGLPVAEAERIRELEARINAIHQRNITRMNLEGRTGSRRRQPSYDDLGSLVKKEEEVI